MDIYIGNDHVSYQKYVPNVCWSYYTLLNRRIPLPEPSGLFLLDSGGFQFIRHHGRYTRTPRHYLEKVKLLRPDIWVIQDWMCEPPQVQKTGKSIREHLYLTVESYIDLIDLSAKYALNDGVDLGYLLPVIQGWELNDYLECCDLYDAYGLLSPYMGVGSICRRGSTSEIIKICQAIKHEYPGIELHGFGVKMKVLNMAARFSLFKSIDSAAGQFMRKGKDGKWVTTKSGLHETLTNYYLDLCRVVDDAAKQQTLTSLRKTAT